MPNRFKVLVASAILALSQSSVAIAQVDQAAIARNLLEGTPAEQEKAVAHASTLGVARIDNNLRAAMIEALVREGERHAQGRATPDASEFPILLPKLARLVAEFRDPQAIPALAEAMSTSPPAMKALAEFGEPAAGAVLSAYERSAHPPMIIAALLTLRYMAEGVGAEPLSPMTLHAIRRVAEERLTSEQLDPVLQRAMDLAWALDDPELMAIVEAIASDPEEVIQRGITDPDLIERTQRHAADRLAGIPPLPRW